MHHHIDLQNACKDTILVNKTDLTLWAKLPLIEHKKSGELTVRLVTSEEIMRLNSTYRQQHKATNVLAFPSNLPASVTLDYPLLGDVIICPAVLLAESLEDDIPLKQHWAHIIIHGVLHLLGYDHINEEDTQRMQTIEIQLLAKLGFSNPYISRGYDV